MYELLLLFTRATRQSLWDLPLAPLEAIIPHFFLHDLQNYARLVPVYIAQMRNIKIYEEETRKLFENGNFSVNKSHFLFSAIGADHGIEQLNRELKVVGGKCSPSFYSMRSTFGFRVRGFSQKKKLEERVKR